MDANKLARPGVLDIAPYQPGKSVESVERELGISNIIKLASNENPMGPSAKVKEAIAKAAEDISRYPDGNGERLKQDLANLHHVAAEQITLGNGSNDVLELIVRVFAKDGDEVIFAEYAFIVYALATMAVGATKVVVPAVGYGHDLAAMAAAVTDNTRLVFIANPNNPTGTWNSAQSIQNFMQHIRADVFVIVDEAYFEYVDEAEYASALDLLSTYPNLVVTRTFSKIYGLAALRVGYSISSPEIANLMNRVRQPFNVNSLAQAAAQAALKDKDYVLQSRAVNAAEMGKLNKSFVALGCEPIPSVGNFVSVNIGPNAQPVFESMLQQGVIVRPVAGYGLPDHLRITVGLPDENERMMDALQTALKATA
ncbi:MAG: histidinol-phosphate transaminase [Arenicellales bacterium WSBS_2016_MAG_OTU3]